jgi:hypothetical protein
MEAATTRGSLQGAIALELQHVEPAVAADYLIRVKRPPPAGWEKLADRLLVPGSAVAMALSSPLTLTLVRDTYNEGDDVREFLDFCDAAGPGVRREDIEDHLLDRVLPSAYTQRPGDPPARYDLAAAERALGYIASEMNAHATRDLAWWEMPSWASSGPRVIMTVLVAFLGMEIISALVGNFGPESGIAFLIEVVIIFTAALLGWEGFLSAPVRIAPLWWRKLFNTGPIASGLAFGLIGFVSALGIGSGYRLVVRIVNWLRTGPIDAIAWPGFHRVAALLHFYVSGFGITAGLNLGASLGAGLIVGLATWLWFGFMDMTGFEEAGADTGPTTALTPAASWRHDRISALVLGLGAGLMAGLGLGFLAALRAGPSGVFGLSGIGDPNWLGGLGPGEWTALVGGPVIGLVVALIASRTWGASLAFAQLGRRRHVPVRLMRFLEDACERDVLRTVGPVYQFRHARLQDRLAGPSTLISSRTSEHAAATSHISGGVAGGQPDSR